MDERLLEDSQPTYAEECSIARFSGQRGIGKVWVGKKMAGHKGQKLVV